ncbi:hypothetical protein [Burkholderia perseverans]|uniref:hypothetical protein n=1 Tax=Burkholderia perseverans TaxID=2615214 RepID=UPI001FEE2673|nr:hypothetical protein [Burkholderia perseverans]
MFFKPKQTRDLTASFIHEPEAFLGRQVVVPDFAKGISDNYTFHHDPNWTKPVPENERSAMDKMLGLAKTKMVAPETQRELALRKASEVISSSGLKTHFFRVMEDRERKNVANLTPDMEAYRNKLEAKRSKYYAVPTALTEKHSVKLEGLEKVVKAFEGFEAKDRGEKNEGQVMQAGYFPYEQTSVGFTNLHTRKNQSGRWVFTGAMSGCAIAVENIMNQRTSSADNVNTDARAHHFPSPGSNSGMLASWLPDRQLSGWFGSSGYGDKVNVEAFNALHVHGPDITLYSQRHARSAKNPADIKVQGLNVFTDARRSISHLTEMLAENSDVPQGWTKLK